MLVVRKAQRPGKAPHAPSKARKMARHTRARPVLYRPAKARKNRQRGARPLGMARAPPPMGTLRLGVVGLPTP